MKEHRVRSKMATPSLSSVGSLLTLYFSDRILIVYLQLYKTPEPVSELSLSIPLPKTDSWTDLPSPHLTVVFSSHPPSPSSTLSSRTTIVESAHQKSLTI